MSIPFLVCFLCKETNFILFFLITCQLSMEKRLSSLADVQPLNGGFKEYTRPHPKRVQFFQRLAKGESVKNIVEDLLHVPLWRRILRAIKELCRRIFQRKLTCD
jgi:predicted metallopeptidase